jgi:2-dehydro-3-deoxygluconokinase
MCVPGGLSDAGKQLAQKAELYGCDFDDLREKHPHQWVYKLFPTAAGSALNVETALAWKGPYKGLTIIYTGGVSLKNLRELAQKDPDGIFCGSALTGNVDDPAEMKEEASRWLSAIHDTCTEKKPEARATAKRGGTVPRVVTFGEIMMRLSPPDHQRFLQAASYDANFGGAEANVAVMLANFGLRSSYVTALPENDLGQAAVNSLRKFGVDTTHILRQGKKLGLYFLEHGASQRPSVAIYDRAGSSISEIKPGQIPWVEVFENAAWFHCSGITPALGDSAAEAALESVKAAKKAGLTVSLDLNFRKNLWSKEKAQRVMPAFMATRRTQATSSGSRPGRRMSRRENWTLTVTGT